MTEKLCALISAKTGEDIKSQFTSCRTLLYMFAAKTTHASWGINWNRANCIEKLTWNIVTNLSDII